MKLLNVNAVIVAVLALGLPQYADARELIEFAIRMGLVETTDWGTDVDVDSGNGNSNGNSNGNGNNNGNSNGKERSLSGTCGTSTFPAAVSDGVSGYVSKDAFTDAGGFQGAQREKFDDNREADSEIPLPNGAVRVDWLYDKVLSSKNTGPYFHALLPGFEVKVPPESTDLEGERYIAVGTVGAFGSPYNLVGANNDQHDLIIEFTEDTVLRAGFDLLAFSERGEPCVDVLIEAVDGSVLFSGKVDLPSMTMAPSTYGLTFAGYYGSVGIISDNKRIKKITAKTAGEGGTFRMVANLCFNTQLRKVGGGMGDPHFELWSGEWYGTYAQAAVEPVYHPQRERTNFSHH